MSLTTRQADLVRIIEEHHRQYGFAPTVRELQNAVGATSRGALHRDLVTLRDKGLIEWDHGRYRTIRVIDQ